MRPEAELRSQIQGEVRFDEGSRALYATDASNYRQVPIGVVIPKDIDDVVRTIAACRKYGAPVLARGCGTSLAGERGRTASNRGATARDCSYSGVAVRWSGHLSWSPRRSCWQAS